MKLSSIAVYQQWLDAKKRLTNQEIDNYLNLAKAESDERIAGAAVTQLFTSPMISEGQFKMLKLRLPEFGDWTKKLIQRETLKRKLEKEKVTPELFQACLQYKKDFKDNRLLFLIIKQTDNEDILADFETNGSGKQLRTLATKKLNQLKRDAKKTR